MSPFIYATSELYCFHSLVQTEGWWCHLSASLFRTCVQITSNPIQWEFYQFMVYRKALSSSVAKLTCDN